MGLSIKNGNNEIKRKAVFFDIDGTLWDAQMQIPQSTIAAIRQLRQNGHYAFICSGRSRASICAPRLFDVGFDGVLAGCGTYIEFDGKVVYENLMTCAQRAEVLGVLDALHMPVIIEGREDLFADLTAFAADKYVAYLKGELGEHMRDRSELTDETPVSKVSAECSPDTLDAFCAALGGKYELVFHESVVVEILPKGFSKAVGIERACGLLGIAHEDTYAFGDSTNDLEMLSYVAHGAAMGNASDNAKAAAEYVTSDIHEDGIFNGLKHYGLID